MSRRADQFGQFALERLREATQASEVGLVDAVDPGVNRRAGYVEAACDFSIGDPEPISHANNTLSDCACHSQSFAQSEPPVKDAVRHVQTVEELRLPTVSKKGSAYPISPEWRDRVEARLVELGISRAELGRRAKISKTSITDMLSPESKQSAAVPQVHKALGWPPPPPLVLASDTQELIGIFEGLTERDRGALLERARILSEQLRRK